MRMVVVVLPACRVHGACLLSRRDSNPVRTYESRNMTNYNTSLARVRCYAKYHQRQETGPAKLSGGMASCLLSHEDNVCLRLKSIKIGVVNSYF
jgi:hypothetical protein